MQDEGVLDPWVADWFAANPFMNQPFDDLNPEMLALARGPAGGPPSRELASVTDEDVDGVPVRIYRADEPPTGIVVYFHGGGFVIGSIGLMDNVARELTHATGAVVVSVGYRLAPEDPYPAGLDDCVAVTRWALANTARFGVAPGAVAVAGESAGGNLSTTVALRLRDAGGPTVAAQVLLYPAVGGESITNPSRRQFTDGPVINKKAMLAYWEAYCGGRVLDRVPYAAPLHAEDLTRLPPALVIVAGCDPLRDEGRAYADRLRRAGVEVEDSCADGQPHGYVNFLFPASEDTFARVGAFVRARLAGAVSAA